MDLPAGWGSSASRQVMAYSVYLSLDATGSGRLKIEEELLLLAARGPVQLWASWGRSCGGGGGDCDGDVGVKTAWYFDWRFIVFLLLLSLLLTSLSGIIANSCIIIIIRNNYVNIKLTWLLYVYIEIILLAHVCCY